MRSAMGRKKAYTRYKAEQTQLEAEIKERFGTAKPYDIFTKSGLYQQKTAEATVQALQANTRVYNDGKLDTSSWWYRIARMAAIERGLQGSAFQTPGKLSNFNRIFFIGNGS